MSSRIDPIFLVDKETGRQVNGTLIFDPTYDEIEQLDSYWTPYVNLALKEIKMRGETYDAVPDYLIWKWSAKMSKARHSSWRFFCIAYRDCIQGALVVSTKPTACKSSEHDGQLGLGIEFLATAPWNIGRFMRPIRRQPFLDLVGPTLMRVAISMSQATQGCEGRLYLYAVPKAETFYSGNCGMIDIGIETHDGEALRRFEMSSDRAAEFIAEG
jgi:hypothetical protein